MKLIKSTWLLLAVTLLIATSSVNAAKAQKKIVEKRFSAVIHCENCVKKVMNTLPYQKGVKNVVCDIKSSTITVEFDSAKSSDEAIVTALKKVGVDAKIDDGTPFDTTQADSCSAK